MKNLKTLASAILSVLADFIVWVAQVVIELLLVVSKTLKRYTGIENCIYRHWWKLHSKKMQKRLDLLHGTEYAKDGRYN